MAPFPLEELLGKAGMYLVYLFIGFSFGAVLEMAGFASSPKLAAQFYFKDMTVLKVMFGAIVVAMLLVFGASGLGLLDYNRIWSIPTYLWPGIIGGLIMGFGFIIGGFCPGTSLVAVATLKWDGMAFALGALTGIFVFGESVARYSGFFYSSFHGRLTLPDVFGVSAGVVALGITIMAVLAFAAAEQAERVFGDKDPGVAPKSRYLGALLVVIAGVGLVRIGQPTIDDRWEWVADAKQAQLDSREVQIHPGELLDLMSDNRIKLLTFDLRDEADFNLFHIVDAERVDAGNMAGRAVDLLAEPENTVVVLMSNDEVAAIEAWKSLVAQDVPNVYILDGGINRWLDIFGHQGHEGCITGPAEGDDRLRHVFGTALGSAVDEAEPDAHAAELDFEPKVKLEKKKPVGGGGCG